MSKKWMTPLLLLILLTASMANADSWNGWIYQNPYPTAVDLGDVKFITALKGWVVGKYGSIFFTSDGGETWEAQESGTEEHLLKVYFINENSGWVAGIQGSIIHTKDGGKTWANQYNAKMLPTKIFFINEQEGWVTGSTQAGGSVYRTRNGGKTWEKAATSISRATSGILFINPRIGWILAGEDVYRTSDGGGKWEKSKLPVGKVPRVRPPMFAGGRPMLEMEEGGLGPEWRYGGIAFADEKHGWAAVYHWIFHTDDGGKNWVMQFDTRNTNHGFTSVAFRDTLNGCAAGWSVLCTEDGGKTWHERLGAEPLDDNMLGGLSLVGQSGGWTVGSVGRILKTVDGGKSWKASSAGMRCGDRTVLADKNVHWLWGSRQSSICKTGDQGQTWVKQDLGIKLTDLFFIDDSRGWALGCQEEAQEPTKGKKAYQVLKQTVDGGQTWKTQFKELSEKPSCFIFDLSSVFFLNSNTGWIVGNRGIILHTTNGGDQWERLHSGTTLHLQAINFGDSDSGIIIGDRRIALGEDRENDKKAIGKIFYTNDGGKNWRVTWEKNPVLLTGLYFLDANTGWITAETLDGNLLLFSENGGKTWKETALNIYGYSPYSPYFIDRNRGVLLLEDSRPGESQNAAMLVTNNGFKTWTKIKVPLRKRPWHVSELFNKTILEAK